MSDVEYDDAIVGAGILGLAHAERLARRGRRVLVIERSPRAQGASIRNFGMLWPIGQPIGPRRDLAMRSLAIWQDVLTSANLWYDRSGSLHLAYHDDEAAVLEEFVQNAGEPSFPCEILNPKQVRAQSPYARLEGLRTGLWSPSEIGVDPREVVAKLPEYLAKTYGVAFIFGQAVIGYESPRVITSHQQWRADRLWVCSGDDLETLYPDVFREAGLYRCKLQMMRSEPLPQETRLGPMLAAGSTLRHYASFENCPSLPAMKARFSAERPEFDRFGIHVMASQNGLGEIVIGDSHEYGDAIDPFDKTQINTMVLEYLFTFLDMPTIRIASRWHGTYAKSRDNSWTVAKPAPGVTVVTGVGGAGMTLSFGLADRVVRETLGEGESS